MNTKQTSKAKKIAINRIISAIANNDDCRAECIYFATPEISEFEYKQAYSKGLDMRIFLNYKPKEQVSIDKVTVEKPIQKENIIELPYNKKSQLR